MHSKLRLIGLFIAYGLVFTVVDCHAQSNGNNAAAGPWKRYDLAKGAFTVLLPDKPDEKVIPAEATQNVSVDNYVYAVRTEQGFFVTQYSFIGEAAEQWSETAGDAFYEGFWTTVSASFDKQMEENKLPKTKLLEKRKGSLGGKAGQELIFTVAGMQGRILITRTGRHAFAAMVIRPETTPAADVEKFFSSFTINQNKLFGQKESM